MMANLNKIKETILARGAKRNIQDLIIIFIIGLSLVILYNFFSSNKVPSPGYVEVNKTAEAQESSANLSYEDKMTQELTDVLEQIEGAGKVKVMIYFNSGSEVVPAYSENESNRVTEESDSDGGKRTTNEKSNSNTIVTTSEGNESRPFILKEVKPKISGIIVVAEGASNPNVKYKLYEAVRTVFNIEQYRVNVYAMEKNK